MLHLALHSLSLALVDLQAGGGGSFGGGGGGGGGGGDGGDGAGFLIYLLIRLVFEYPLIGVPLAIVVIFVIAKSGKAGRRGVQNRAIRDTREVRRARSSVVTADSLRASDPSFDEAAFLTRVETAFHKAQEAWCAQQLEAIRPFVSDGVYERFSLQLEEQRAEGWRQGMSGTRTRQLSLAHVDASGIFETVTVRIPFESKIERISLETDKVISGSALPRNHFEECWTFVRRRGTRSKNEAGLLEGQCPNCGAPLDMNQSAKCGSCQAFVRSGEFDWVLTEITQASEWQPESAADVAGWQSFAQRDPDLSVQLLEDRASVAFWRECAVRYRGEVAPLVRIADAAFVERYAELLEPYDGLKRVYTGDCAVGSVRTLGVLTGSERDRAVVEIVWDGRRARIDADGSRSIERDRMLRRSLYVLSRKAGSKTRALDTFATAICRTCGAHDAGGTDPLCPYCEAPRTGDDGTWLLTESFLRGTAEAHALLEELEGADAASFQATQAEVPSPAGLLAWSVALVRADGEVDERERRALDQLAQRLGLDASLVERALNSEDGDTPTASSPTVGRRWLTALIELALDDGRLSGVETFFLRDAASRMGVSRKELNREVDALRTALYRDAKAARKGR